MHRPMLLDQFLEIGFNLKDTEEKRGILGNTELNMEIYLKMSTTKYGLNWYRYPYLPPAPKRV